MIIVINLNNPKVDAAAKIFDVNTIPGKIIISNASNIPKKIEKGEKMLIYKYIKIP